MEPRNSPIVWANFARNVGVILRSFSVAETPHADEIRFAVLF
jgi:hypothetical protein